MCLDAEVFGLIHQVRAPRVLRCPKWGPEKMQAEMISWHVSKLGQNILQKKQPLPLTEHMGTLAPARRLSWLFNLHFSQRET